ncbi:MAG: flagellar export chaperone FliS [Phycisphaerales bacterium]
MNDTNTANAYLRTKVMTASPEELRLMLLDGAIKFANQALTGIEDTDHEMIYLGFTQCRDIVLELLNTIKTEPAPEVAQSMRELYTFLYGELVRASTDSDADRVREVIKLLEYDRETWILTMEQLVKDREAGIAPVAPAPASAHQPISFQA